MNTSSCLNLFYNSARNLFNSSKEVAGPWLNTLASYDLAPVFGGVLVARGLFEANETRSNKFKALTSLAAGAVTIAAGYQSASVQSDFILKTLKVVTLALAVSPFFLSMPKTSKKSEKVLDAKAKAQNYWTLSKKCVTKAHTAASLSTQCAISALACLAFSLKLNAEQYITAHASNLNPGITILDLYSCTFSRNFQSCQPESFKNTLLSMLDPIKASRWDSYSLIHEAYINLGIAILIVTISTLGMAVFEQKAKEYKKMAENTLKFEAVFGQKP